MVVNRANTSLMDISKFHEELKRNRDYSEFCIHTENYTLMKKEYYDYLIEISEKHEERKVPIETYSVHGKPVKVFGRKLYSWRSNIRTGEEMIDEKKLIEIVREGNIDGIFTDELIAVIEEQPKIGKWIPCSERLPEECENVLVWYEYFRYGDYNRMFQTYGIGYHVEGHWRGDVNGVKARCIAWIPLPEPYNE